MLTLNRNGKAIVPGFGAGIAAQIYTGMRRQITHEAEIFL